MPYHQLILWDPFLHLPSIFPRIRDFSSELVVRYASKNLAYLIDNLNTRNLVFLYGILEQSRHSEKKKKVLENHVEFEGLRSERSYISDLLILQRPRIFHIFSPFQHRLSISRIRVYRKLDFTFLKLESMLVVWGPSLNSLGHSGQCNSHLGCWDPAEAAFWMSASSQSTIAVSIDGGRGVFQGERGTSCPGRLPTPTLHPQPHWPQT